MKKTNIKEHTYHDHQKWIARLQMELKDKLTEDKSKRNKTGIGKGAKECQID